MKLRMRFLRPAPCEQRQRARSLPYPLRCAQSQSPEKAPRSACHDRQSVPCATSGRQATRRAGIRAVCDRGRIRAGGDGDDPIEGVRVRGRLLRHDRLRHVVPGVVGDLFEDVLDRRPAERPMRWGLDRSADSGDHTAEQRALQISVDTPIAKSVGSAAGFGRCRGCVRGRRLRYGGSTANDV
jgi:hypothetical protein